MPGLAARDAVEATVREEILDRGIRFPSGGLRHGLADFPTSFEDRWVYLCWERGEPEAPGVPEAGRSGPRPRGRAHRGAPASGRA